MRIFVLASGSSGNALLVDDGHTRIVVDAGIGPRAAVERLRRMGDELIGRPVQAIVVTHEHGDHIAHAGPLSRALRCPVFLHPGIAALPLRRRVPIEAYEPGQALTIGTMRMEALAVPHDAPQVALRFVSRHGSFGLATDLGSTPGAVLGFLRACDVVLLEANYCERLLASGPYPERLKRRVASDVGHLSNDQAADAVQCLERGQTHTVLLGHVSHHNNEPEVALRAVRRKAKRARIEVIPHGASHRVDAVEPRQLTLFSSVEQAPLAKAG